MSSNYYEGCYESSGDQIMTKKTQEENEVKVPEMKTIVVQHTNAEKIWNEIKNKPLDMFALAGQTAEKFCKVVPIDTEKLFLTYTVSAVIPAIEAVIGDKLQLETMDKFIVISRKPYVV